MAVLHTSKLGPEKLEAFPCVCCGISLGMPPCSDSFWICPICGWEEESFQFRLPWVPAGPNRHSLWHARRNAKTTGYASGFVPGSWTAADLSEAYPWDLDPNMYADYAASPSVSCPIMAARDVLRAGGYFSLRQIQQKMRCLGRESPGYLQKIVIGNQSISRSPDGRSILRVDVTEVSPGSVHRYIKDLAAVREEDLSQLKFDFALDSSITVGPRKFSAESKYIAKIDAECSWDSNSYWVRVAFAQGRLERIMFTSSRDGWGQFEDLDKDSQV